MVPLAEIASETNDYNLNIPRYIDSSEGEDLHDLVAHLRGGILDQDINALGDYWKVFPGLRSRLFSPNGREGYSDVRAEAGDVRSVVIENEEFVEEYSGEDGLLEGATTDAGRVTQAAVRKRLKVVRNDPGGRDERDALEVCLDLMKSLAAARGRRKRHRRSWTRKCLLGTRR